MVQKLKNGKQILEIFHITLNFEFCQRDWFFIGIRQQIWYILATVIVQRFQNYAIGKFMSKKRTQ